MQQTNQIETSTSLKLYRWAFIIFIDLCSSTHHLLHLFVMKKSRKPKTSQELFLQNPNHHNLTKHFYGAAQHKPPSHFPTLEVPLDGTTLSDDLYNTIHRWTGLLLHFGSFLLSMLELRFLFPFPPSINNTVVTSPLCPFDMS